MFGTILVAGFCIVALTAIVAALLRRRGAGRISRTGSRVPMPSAGMGLFGLAPGDADRFQHLAREQMRLDRAQWGRDYLPGMSDGTPPGRVSGIPRSLRVRH